MKNFLYLKQFNSYGNYVYLKLVNITLIIQKHNMSVCRA